MKYSNITEKLIVFQNKFYQDDSGKVTDPIVTQNYQIIQVADSYYLSAFNIDEHYQFCDIEITYVLYNSLLCFSEGVWAPIAQNEAYISLRGEKHALGSDGKCRFITIAFNINEESPCRALMNEIREKINETGQRTLALSGLAALATKVISEVYKTDAPWQTFSLDSLLTQILVGLVEESDPKRNDIFEEGKSLIPKVLSHLDEVFTDIDVIEKLPGIFGYSYNYIYKLFKKYNGVTVRDYLFAKRMEFAKNELLKKTKVEDIAYALGYKNASNFSRAFKKYTGVSPAFFASIDDIRNL